MKNFLLNLFRLVRIPTFACALGLAVLAANPVLVQAANECQSDPVNHAELADDIANGHAFIKHAAEFEKGKVIAGLAFPSETITNENDFASFLKSILDNPSSSKALQRGRAAYWHKQTGTIIIYNPKPEDCGTAFRPTSGESYYTNLQ